MTRKAFTLIELLVVIAIIAILAAILFPVFAQAKTAAKKAAMISNVKQTATSIIIYTTDADDTFSGGASPNLSTGGFWESFPSACPATAWPAGGYVPAEEALAWANATDAYRKNYGILAHTAPQSTLGPQATMVNPQVTSLAFNGLLQFYSATSVNEVSKCPLIWPGWGSENVSGFSIANPVLRCGTQSQCRFAPGANPGNDASVTPSGNSGARQWIWGAGAGSFSHYHYAQQNVMSFTDTSARSFRVSDVANPVGTYPNPFLKDPWAGYSTGGVPTANWTCNSPNATVNGVHYPCFFRPDQVYN